MDAFDHQRTTEAAMLDDIRNHDPLPTAEEREWIALHEVGSIARGVLLAVVALAIGWAASDFLDAGVRDAVAIVAPR